MASSNSKPIEWTDETLEKAINGAITVTRVGQNVPYKLTSQEKQAFAQGKEQGYVLAGKRDNLTNAFSQWCELHQRPYIYVKQRGKSIDVTMDLIFCEDTGYREDPLFREKLLTVIAAVGKPSVPYGPGGTYTYVQMIPADHAEYVARSFSAIYQQHTGLTVKAPAFPESAKDAVLFAQIQTARAQKYAHCTTIRNWISWRWKEFCSAYHWPTIMLDEKRKGTAKVDVSLPKGVTFHPDVRQAIIRAAQESGLKADTAGANVTDKLFLCYDTHTYMTHPIPTSDATRFASNIVTILEKAGHFPAIDESWHQ